MGRRRELGTTLRLAGPLIQVLCLLLLFGTSLGRARRLGVRVDLVLYGAFFLGLVLALVGVALSLGTRRPR